MSLEKNHWWNQRSKLQAGVKVEEGGKRTAIPSRHNYIHLIPSRLLQERRGKQIRNDKREDRKVEIILIKNFKFTYQCITGPKLSTIHLGGDTKTKDVWQKIGKVKKGAFNVEGPS